tara:strand:+ start:474 stop:767 length:294 start_codon:yes stop_codon:yes gene_type:complete
MIDELLKELQEDSFRSERGKINDCTLISDCLALFDCSTETLNSEIKVNFNLDKDPPVREETRVSGSGIFSALAYQNLILLKRLEVLEEEVKVLRKPT